jgi:succinyl-CoA synthetase beta subunit
LFKTSDEKIIAVDCKMGLDENALMRHNDLAAMRDVTEEDPTEVEAGQYNLNFVKLMVMLVAWLTVLVLQWQLWI